MTTELVCPNCGSNNLATRERAEIWQPATFTLTDQARGVVETSKGEPVEIYWDAYNSEDVGDTETVGYVCKECIWTWGEEGNTNTVPFVTREEFETTTRER